MNDEMKINDMLASFFFDNGMVRTNDPTEDEINELKEYYNYLIFKKNLNVGGYQNDYIKYTIGYGNFDKIEKKYVKNRLKKINSFLKEFIKEKGWTFTKLIEDF